IGTSSYPQTILDWAKTRKVNGKIISDLRKKVRERLTLQGGDEYESAVAAKETVNKYWQHKDREYKKFKELEAELE
ncbi:deoxyribodipyrimidine photo-lyase, partial [Nostoc sp. FACHB-888]|nr:deoxyribodipyrimidine photo-lyase [Nostoc sp. FACHB-888]